MSKSNKGTAVATVETGAVTRKPAAALATKGETKPVAAVKATDTAVVVAPVQASNLPAVQAPVQAPTAELTQLSKETEVDEKGKVRLTHAARIAAAAIQGGWTYTDEASRIRGLSVTWSSGTTTTVKNPICKVADFAGMFKRGKSTVYVIAGLTRTGHGTSGSCYLQHEGGPIRQVIMQYEQAGMLANPADADGRAVVPAKRDDFKKNIVKPVAAVEAPVATGQALATVPMPGAVVKA